MEPNTKIYKCGFIAEIKTVSLAIKIPCLLSVFWKRGIFFVIKVKKLQKFVRESKSRMGL